MAHLLEKHLEQQSSGASNMPQLCHGYVKKCIGQL
ncbi:hypothetical protein Ae707Ps1_4230c [Pseudonocardia sp. Ae707_Ps1]|nr:hypothetical protein Ae707Ps1_4230c [Pseudonocardia sp. Ae707_Ps1]